MEIQQWSGNLPLPEWDATCSPLQAVPNAEFCLIVQHLALYYILLDGIKKVRSKYLVQGKMLWL